MYYLVVVHELAKYKKGEHITDQAMVTNILADERKHRVVKRLIAAATAPSDPAPADAAVTAHVGPGTLN